ncbi:MAG: extracellular solute-binding protein [Clostridia bacterium]|nr:extracellular solute-binding protein [Clostridia bacterium]
MKHLLHFCLPLLCLLLLLCSCGQTQPDATAAAETGETLLGIPETADFGGAEYRVLSAGNVTCKDFTAEEDASTPLDVSQYKRRALVESNYNVKISEDVETAYSSGSGPGFKALYYAAAAGDAEYNVGLIAGYDVSVLGYSGSLYDMNSIAQIDLSKPWWDQKANETLAIHDLIFFTVGDFTLANNNAAYVIMFNKELLKDYGLQNPYDMVYDNEWTLENFGKLCKTVTEDLNDDGVMDENDRYGLLVWVDSLLGMVNAAGQRCCVVDENSQITLSLYNETTMDAVDRFLAIALDRQYALQYQSIHNTSEFAAQLWSGEHGLFWTTTVGSVPKFREMKSDFGLLPYPKLTETQENYYSTVTPYNSQFLCVPLIQEDLELTGTVTEALAYYGRRDVLPAYYDVNLKGMVSRDEESSDMLDIIFDNLVYDIGYLYQIGPYNKNFNYMVSRKETNFASMYESLRNTAQAQLDRINAEYLKAVERWK